jgi:hypothetical protein
VHCPQFGTQRNPSGVSRGPNSVIPADAESLSSAADHFGPASSLRPHDRRKLMTRSKRRAGIGAAPIVNASINGEEGIFVRRNVSPDW